MMKKCVIIGSGLGGLACGCILAKNGYEVTVLEQGAQIGGCLQCFRRGDALFETGMHYIGSAEPGQVLYTFLHYLGVDQKIQLSKLNPKGYDVISFKGQHYLMANGKEAFVETLAQQFPQSREELSRYYDLVKQVASSWAMHSLRKDVDLNVNAEYQMRSVNEVIDSLITDPTLREVLAGIVPLYAGEKDHTPFYVHALIADSYDQSASRIVGGSSVVADALADAIRERGGQVLVKRMACQIECDDKQATAVITSDGERYAADLVISAIHPAKTMQMVQSRLIRPAYRQRIIEGRNSTSAFTVYLKFRKDSVPYMDHNFYYYRGDSVWGCEQYDEASWPKFLLYMHFCQEANPVYATTGEILTYMTMDEVRQWEGTHVGRRGESYEAFKQKKAEAAIAALEEEMPGLSEKIEAYYTSTPLTYIDYTGVPEGALYGMMKDVDLLGSAGVTSRTRVPNLLLSGQSITLHGMMGVLAGSMVTCSEVLTMEEIISQLNQA